MNCPVCKDVTLVMADRQGVEVDYCPQCRGVWLDRGELDKIIERSAVAGSASLEPERYTRGVREEHEHRDYDDDDYHGKSQRRGRRGFLGELFDFG